LSFGDVLGLAHRSDGGEGLWAVKYRLDVVPVRVPDEGGVIAFGVLHPNTRGAPLATAVLQRGRVEGVDRLAARGVECHVRPGR
jgi:hypothetical protein